MKMKQYTQHINNIVMIVFGIIFFQLSSLFLAIIRDDSILTSTSIDDIVHHVTQIKYLISNFVMLLMYTSFFFIIIEIILLIITIITYKKQKKALLINTHDENFKYCNQCGEKIGSNAQFCSLCGAKNQ